MKLRESGMPDESMWSGFFSPEQTLTKLGLTGSCRDVVDFGCGYGTFTIPAARIAQGTVHAFDIEAEMATTTARKVEKAGLTNVRVERRDFATDGTGLPDESADYAMLFNILHCEQPEILLREAWRVLVPNGRLGVMHWNHNPDTPRGPSMAIRPRPQQCIRLVEVAGFERVAPVPIDLPPYHWGCCFRRPARSPG